MPDHRLLAAAADSAHHGRCVCSQLSYCSLVLRRSHRSLAWLCVRAAVSGSTPLVLTRSKSLCSISVRGVCIAASAGSAGAASGLSLTAGLQVLNSFVVQSGRVPSLIVCALLDLQTPAKGLEERKYATPATGREGKRGASLITSQPLSCLTLVRLTTAPARPFFWMLCLVGD